MSRRYISESLRVLVAERAMRRCVYCRLPESRSFFAFHIDHIVSLKHSGATTAENLAFACQICNLNKGSDIATFLENPTEPVRFFNPRKDIWTEHFDVDELGFIEAKTLVGEATIKIFDLNYLDSIIERREMLLFGIF